MHLSIVAALTIGFFHAFEIDHIVAVTNLTTTNKNIKQALKDGALWGLGHTSSIFMFGILILLLKMQFNEGVFSNFEILVGIMLIGIGMWRIIQSYNNFKKNIQHGHQHYDKEKNTSWLAYSIGLIHGLAGSGALILLVLSQSVNSSFGMLYLLLFGVGSIIGMVAASSLLSFPLLKFFQKYKYLSTGLTYLSAILCIVVGIKLAIKI